MARDGHAVLIGIDGMPWWLQSQLFEDGVMPRLKRLASSGASATLKSTLPAITPAAWASFQTGMNPGRNGVFDFSAWDPDKKKRVSSNSSSLEPTLWEYLSSAGYSIGVLNVPMTYPPREVNGFVVSGIQTPSTDAQFTYPPELKDELLEEVQDYHIFTMDNIKEVSPHEDVERFVDSMAEIVQMRSRAARYLLETRQPDVMMVHFQASDVLQHTLWPYFDRDHPLDLYSEETTEYIFEEFYRVLDSSIGDVIDSFHTAVDEDPLVFIGSDHGFQAHVKRFNLGNWLVDRGYLAPNERGMADPVIVRMLKRVDLGGFIRDMVPQRVKDAIRDTSSTIEGRPEPFDWRTSRAYSIGRSGEGFIYLLKENREGLIQELTEQLGTIEDPESGDKVVREVHRTEAIYDADDLTTFPDLIIEPANGYSFTGQYSPRSGLFHRVTPEEDFHLGKHHPDGIMILSGGGVKQPNGSLDLVDIAPTLLHYFGVQADRKLDGKVRTDAFDDSLDDPSEIATVEEGQSEYVFSEEEVKSVEERLQDLGYR